MNAELARGSLLSRAEFNEYLKTADLSNAGVRAYIHNIVIDEVIKEEFKVQQWDVAGFPPLDTSCTKFLRPVPKCVFGLDGWHVYMGEEWFVD